MVGPAVKLLPASWSPRRVLVVSRAVTGTNTRVCAGDEQKQAMHVRNKNRQGQRSSSWLIFLNKPALHLGGVNVLQLTDHAPVPTNVRVNMIDRTICWLAPCSLLHFKNSQTVLSTVPHRGQVEGDLVGAINVRDG
jgi:hypothetical protein